MNSRTSSFLRFAASFAISLSADVAHADVRSLPLPGVPSAVASVSSLGRIYIATSQGLLVFDPQNDSVLATIPLNATPLSFAFDPTFNTLFVPSSSAGFVDLVDAPSNQVPVVIPLSSPPTAIAVDSQNQHLYAALPAEKILKVVDMSGIPFAFAPDVHLSDIPTAVTINPGVGQTKSKRPTIGRRYVSILAVGPVANIRPRGCQAPVNVVVSMGRRNTFLEFTRRSLKT